MAWIFSRWRVVFQRWSGPRIVRGRRWVGRGRCDRPSTGSRRNALGRNGGWAKPGKKWPCCHVDQRERIALRYGSLGDGRRRPLFLAVHDLWLGAHRTARVGGLGHKSKTDDLRYGFRQLRWRQEPFVQGRLQPASRQIRGWKDLVQAFRRRERHRTASPCLQQTAAS